MAKLTGKASYITIDGVNVKFTKVDLDVERMLADDTDTGNYASGTDMISPSQIPWGVKVTGKAEGNFQTSQTPTAIVAKLFLGGAAVPVVLGLDASNIAGHGNFDFSKFTVTSVYNDVTKFTLELMSNGAFTPNS